MLVLLASGVPMNLGYWCDVRLNTKWLPQSQLLGISSFLKTQIHSVMYCLNPQCGWCFNTILALWKNLHISTQLYNIVELQMLIQRFSKFHVLKTCAPQNGGVEPPPQRWRHAHLPGKGLETSGAPGDKWGRPEVSIHARCCPRSLAKLVNISSITMVYRWYNVIYL